MKERNWVINLIAIQLCFQRKDQSYIHRLLDTKNLAIVSTTSKFIYTNDYMMAQLQQYIPYARIEDNILTCNSVSLLYMEDVLMMLLSVLCTYNPSFEMRFILHRHVAFLKDSDLIWEKEKGSCNVCKSIIRIMPEVAEMKGMSVLHHIIQSLIHIQLIGLSILKFFSRCM
jgi:hypothetical protein